VTAKLCALVVALAVITRARVAVLPGWVVPVPALTVATALILRARGRDGVADAADAPRGQPPRHARRHPLVIITGRPS
jgi:hypothetical protein